MKLPQTGILDCITYKALQKIDNEAAGTTGHAKLEPARPITRTPQKQPKTPQDSEIETPKDDWTPLPWNKERQSTFRLAQIHQTIQRGNAKNIIPKDAIPIKNRKDFEQLTRNGVLIEYFHKIKISGFSRQERLAHTGWTLYTDNHKFDLNPTHSRPSQRDLKKRDHEHCEIDPDFSLVLCYRFYRDAVYPDIVYAQGLDKCAGINNGRAHHNQRVYQLTNTGSQASL